MRSQVHNQGKLKELKVSIEANVVEDLKKMSVKMKIPLADLVVIALKRYQASHGDYLGETPYQE